MRIWVDADACPVVIRDIISRAAHRRKVNTVFVANKFLTVAESPFLEFVQVVAGPDVADAYIVERGGSR